MDILNNNAVSDMTSAASGENRFGLRRYLLVVVFALIGAGFSATAFADSLQRLKTSEWKLTNFDIVTVDPDEILSGGPRKDGIPAIDKPAFVSYADAASWLADNEPVVAFEYEGKARAYPLQILMYHEIVNDTVGGKAVSVTFCPLCNASIVFDREVEGEVLDFGTTGRLRKSDLIMYDRQTESWWQQFTGKGIIGDYADTKLKQLPSQIVSFATFRDAFDQGEVLSVKTGFERNYGNNPYAGYDAKNGIPFLYRCLLYTSPSPRDQRGSRMPSSA